MSHRMISFAGRVGLAALSLLVAGPGLAEQPPPATRSAETEPELGAARDPVAEAEARIARVATLDDLLALARARNPDVLESRDRAGAARARASGAGRLPDLELQAEIRNTPLTSPLSFRESEMWMLGLRQTFPAAGSRGARGRAAQADAAVAGESTRARERDVVRDVRRAYWEYHRALRAERIRRESIDLTRRTADLARAAYESGRGSQQDVLRTAVEVARIQADLAGDEQALRSAQVLLNSLVGRDPDAPLGETPDPAPDVLTQGLDDLETVLVEKRPELVAAHRAIDAGQASLDAARRQARLPSVMFEFDYGYVPTQATATTATTDPMSPTVVAGDMNRHFYTVMVGINLPWLNPGRNDAVREAERTLAADRRALEAIRTTAEYQLRDAMARYHSARIAFDQIDRDIVPKARQSLEASQSSFGIGRGDALGLLDSLRSYLSIRLERERALASMEIALADVERAMGDDLQANRAPTPLHPQGTP